MNDAELQDLMDDCPTLYHMAERGSWPSIREHGLLSTTALLDLHGVRGDGRDRIEKARRSGSVTLAGIGLPPAIIRDQKAMDDKALSRCLADGLSPSAWCQMLNRKVFFWLSRERLVRLLRATSYKGREHDVIHVDTRSLISEHRPQITLCAINSGNTRRFPRPRGLGSFSGISDYPYSNWAKTRRRGERVVELAVSPSIPGIAKFVDRVVRMRGTVELETIYARSKTGASRTAAPSSARGRWAPNKESIIEKGNHPR